jgi:hypothetical protein
MTAIAGDSVVVVNEIHYHPADPALEFVELHNQLSVNVDLSGWRFDGGITFGFPEGTVMPARGYLVVAKDPAALQAATGATGTLGPFAGSLANEGETLRLWNNNGALRTLTAPPPPPAAAELWSVDLQGDGVGGVYGQVPPTLMSGPESASGIGGVWNALTIASHPATSVNPGLAALMDSSGAASPVSFAITGTVSGFTTAAAGGSTPLFNDYLFLNAGNSAASITWRLAGVNPAKTHSLWLYGSAARSVRLKVDRNGNGSLTDDPAVTAPAGGGVLVSGILPQPAGIILGNADTPGGETNWSGFQLLVPATGGGGSFDPGTHDDRLDRRRLMDEVAYNDRGDWPVGPDGSGYSLAKIEPQGGGQAANWITSAQLNGSPGAANFSPPGSSATVVLDTSGNQRHATSATGAAFTTGNGGREGEALVCNGTTAVDVPLNVNPATVPNATLGAWVRANQIDSPARHEILSTDDGGYDRALTIDSRSGTAETGIARYSAFGGTTTGVVPGLAATPADGWVFVCAVFDQGAAETRLHVNGNTYSGGRSHGPGTSFLRIGAHPGGAEFFQGAIDTVFAFDRVLTPAEIATIREGGAAALKNPALAANLLGLYEFEPSAAGNSPTGPPVAFNEISGAADAGFAIELHGHGTAPVDLTGWQVRCSNPAATYQFAAGELAAGGYLTLAEATLGFRPLAGAELFLLAPGRLADAVHVTAAAQARAVPGTGRWLRPEATTFGGPNLLPPPAGIVINEIFHTDFNGGDEEWLELLNTGQAGVDLTGWRLAGGIGFAFPPGTSIAAGGFLVIARDAAALTAKYPGRPIIGNFSGRLSDEDSVVLENASGNPADEVAYHHDTPWPVNADRGGSSLELRDAAADNTNPAAWQASQTAHLGAWQTVTYAGVATDDGIGKDAFRDFLLGLLDRGEILIDDVSVREDPAGTNLEFIDNGSFQSDAIGAVPAGWRCLGNHGLGRTQVVADPDDPANRCLRVMATGPTEDKHNRIETTFIGATRQVVVGRTYRISCRARWLAGSNQLNTRLYFNHLQQTTLLSVGDQWGTPGLANSTAVANSGPTAGAVSVQPLVPPGGLPVTVAASLTDPHGVAMARLFYRVNSGAWQSTAMTLDAAGRHTGTVPGQAAGSLVQFHLQATDGGGAVANHPAAGAGGGFFYRVSNNDADTSGLRGNLRILMAPESEALLFTATNRMSNDTFPATVIEDEQLAYHDCRVRLKGSAYGRYAASEFGYHIAFPADRKFRGVHDSVSIERAGNLKELVAKQVLNRAGGGYWSQYDDVAKINGPGVAGIGLLAASRTTGGFLNSLFPGLPTGPLFNHELLYQPNGTVDGNPRSLKLNNPYNHDRGTYELADRGSDPEAYRWGWQIRSQRRDDDYAALVRLNRAFALTGAAFASEIEATVDVDQWLRTWAVMGLYGNDDQYGRIFAHNWRLYQRPGDGRLIALPWDLDRAFNLGTTAPVEPTAFAITRLFGVPAFHRAFDSHVLDLVRTTFNRDHLAAWIDHLGLVTGETAEFAGLPAYVAARANHALATLPASVPFAITTNGGADFTTAAATVTLAGSGWSEVATVTRQGAATPLPLTWTGPTTWTTAVALNSGVNVVALTARNPQGVVVGTDQIAITSTAATLAASAATLVVSELHYHPPDPTPAESAAGFTSEDDFEFIELMNISPAATLNLTGVAFTAGISHEFTGPVLLPPGGRLVLPRRAAAFALRHPGVPVAGEYFLSAEPAGNQFSNGGEQIILRAADGGVIQAFVYDDLAPWPVEPDGTGRSLVLIAPLTNPDPNQPLNWRASAAASGNPGASDALPPFAGDPAADADRNGRADLLDYTFGSGASPAVAPAPDGGLLLTIERNPLAQAGLALESSSDLAPESWRLATAGTLLSRASAGISLERLVFAIPPASPPGGRLFLRARVATE